MIDILPLSAYVDVIGLLLAVILISFTLFNSYRKAKDEAKDIADTIYKIETSRSSIIHAMNRIEVPDTTETQSLLSDISESLKILRDAELDGPKPWESVETLITNYHSQAITQSKIQFYFSLLAASIGFFLIIFKFFTTDITNLAIVYEIIPGVIIDSAAFLFFRQAEQTRERATALYDRLRRDKQRLDAVNIVTSIEDHRVRSAVRAQLALHMAGLKPSPIDLSKYLAVVINE